MRRIVPSYQLAQSLLRLFILSFFSLMYSPSPFLLELWVNALLQILEDVLIVRVSLGLDQDRPYNEASVAHTSSSESNGVAIGF